MDDGSYLDTVQLKESYVVPNERVTLKASIGKEVSHHEQNRLLLNDSSKENKIVDVFKARLGQAQTSEAIFIDDMFNDLTEPHLLDCLTALNSMAETQLFQHEQTMSFSPLLNDFTCYKHILSASYIPHRFSLLKVGSHEKSLSDFKKMIQEKAGEGIQKHQELKIIFSHVATQHSSLDTLQSMLHTIGLITVFGIANHEQIKHCLRNFISDKPALSQIKVFFVQIGVWLKGRVIEALLRDDHQVPATIRLHGLMWLIDEGILNDGSDDLWQKIKSLKHETCVLALAEITKNTASTAILTATLRGQDQVRKLDSAAVKAKNTVLNQTTTPTSASFELLDIDVPADGGCFYHALTLGLIHSVLARKINDDSLVGQHIKDKWVPFLKRHLDSLSMKKYFHSFGINRNDSLYDLFLAWLRFYSETNDLSDVNFNALLRDSAGEYALRDVLLHYVTTHPELSEDESFLQALEHAYLNNGYSLWSDFFLSNLKLIAPQSAEQITDAIFKYQEKTRANRHAEEFSYERIITSIVSIHSKKPISPNKLSQLLNGFSEHYTSRYDTINLIRDAMLDPSPLNLQALFQKHSSQQQFLGKRSQEKKTYSENFNQIILEKALKVQIVFYQTHLSTSQEFIAHSPVLFVHFTNDHYHAGIPRQELQGLAYANSLMKQVNISVPYSLDSAPSITRPESGRTVVHSKELNNKAKGNAPSKPRAPIQEQQFTKIKKTNSTHISNRPSGLDRRTVQPTRLGLSAESRVGVSTGSREQIAGRSGRNGGQGRPSSSSASIQSLNTYALLSESDEIHPELTSSNNQIVTSQAGDSSINHLNHVSPKPSRRLRKRPQPKKHCPIIQENHCRTQNDEREVTYHSEPRSHTAGRRSMTDKQIPKMQTNKGHIKNAAAQLFFTSNSSVNDKASTQTHASSQLFNLEDFMGITKQNPELPSAERYVAGLFDQTLYKDFTQLSSALGTRDDQVRDLLIQFENFDDTTQKGTVLFVRTEPYLKPGSSTAQILQKVLIEHQCDYLENFSNQLDKTQLLSYYKKFLSWTKAIADDPSHGWNTWAYIQYGDAYLKIRKYQLMSIPSNVLWKKAIDSYRSTIMDKNIQTSHAECVLNGGLMKEINATNLPEEISEINELLNGFLKCPNLSDEILEKTGQYIQQCTEYLAPKNALTDGGLSTQHRL